MIEFNSDKIFEWHEACDGIWERDIDEPEIFYAALQKQFEGTGRRFFGITGHISIELVGESCGKLTEEQFEGALQHAWLRLRHSHPSIAVRTIFDKKSRCLKKLYDTAAESQHEVWLEQTFHTISTEQTSAQWCNSDPPAPDLATLFCLRSTRSPTTLRRDLVLRSSHDVIDGIGTLQLLGIYVQHLSTTLKSRSWTDTLDWTSESVRLSPPLRIAANLPNKTSHDVQTALDEAQERSAVIMSESPVMVVPCLREAQSPSVHQRTAMRLDRLTTAAIVRSRKLAAVSITHVYHAAAAIVLASRQERLGYEQNLQYVSYALVNLRGQCQPPYDGTAHAASVYHCTSAEKFGIKFTIPAIGDLGQRSSSEFQRVLAEIKTYYLANRPSTEPMLLRMAPSLWHQGTPRIPEEAWSRPYVMSVPPPNPSPSISMSSFGVIDKLIPTHTDVVSVSNPWVTGEELGPGVGLFLGTFNGELELSAAFNTAWHDTGEIMDYLKDIQAVIQAELSAT